SAVWEPCWINCRLHLGETEADHCTLSSVVNEDVTDGRPRGLKKVIGNRLDATPGKLTPQEIAFTVFGDSIAGQNNLRAPEPKSITSVRSLATKHANLRSRFHIFAGLRHKRQTADPIDADRTENEDHASIVVPKLTATIGEGNLSVVKPRS